MLPVLVALAASITPVHSTKLFNGRDLDGWYVWLQQTKKLDPKAVFSVRDKELRISGEDWGGLTTNAEFRDYHLIVEWRWGGATWGTRKDKARDSGILVHGAGADGAYEGRWLESIESQIIEGGAGDFIVVPGKNKPKLTCDTRELNGQLYWQRGGKGVTRNGGRFNWFGRDPNWTDTLGFRGEHDVEKATGKWNRQEVVCDGNRITNIVNGVIVAHGYDATHTSGKIQIQSEGAEIYFRRIELRPIKDSVKRWIQRNASTPPR